MENFRIHLDGRWELPELADFSRLYYQCYAFMYALEREAMDDEWHPFGGAGLTYPWRGGWSSYNYYETLYRHIPAEGRPTVRQIRYASPGFIEIGGSIEVAYALGSVVTTVAVGVAAAEQIYHRIYKHAQERKLLRLDVRARELEVVEREQAFINGAIDELSNVMGLQSNQLGTISQTPLGTLKILLSFYRRVVQIARMRNDGKLDLE